MSEHVDHEVGEARFPTSLIGSVVLIEVERDGIAVSGVNNGKPMNTRAIRDLLDLLADVLSEELDDETETEGADGDDGGGDE